MKKNFINLRFNLVIYIFLLLFTQSDLFAKWVSLGFDDTWNEGLFSASTPNVLSDVCFDMEKRPHIQVKSGGNFYTYWDGEKWRGLEGSEPTKLDILGDSTISVMKVDSKNFPHFLFTKEETSTIRTLNYTYWNGEKWSGISVVIRLDSDVDGSWLWDTNYDFNLDSDDNPHVVYIVSQNNSDYWHLHYRYMKESKWQSYGDGDKDFGVFNTIDQSTPNFPMVKLDSLGYPHILCSMRVGGGFMDPIWCRFYTFWNGEEWTGIDDSYKLSGGLPLSRITSMAGGPAQWFHIDSSDSAHFMYPAEIESTSSGKEQAVIYRKWDGNAWTGLGKDNDFTKIQLEFSSLWNFYPDLDEENNLSILTTKSSMSNSFMRYQYRQGDSWEGFGGTNIGLGIIPSVIFKPGVGNLKTLDYPLLLIVCRLSGVNKEIPFSFISVLKWEEETEPTIELYTDKFEHTLSGDKIAISGRLNNPFKEPTDVNIIVAMMTPDKDVIFFPSWSKDYSDIPLTLPAGFILPWTGLLSFHLPSDSPPVNKAGTYYFGIFLLNPVTENYYSYDIKQFYVIE